MPPPLSWQGSLLGVGQLAFDGRDRAFARARRDELARGAWVERCTSWLSGGDDLCARLIAELPWTSNTVTMYDQIVREPRLTEFRVHEHLDRFPELKRLVPVLSERYRRDLSRISAALYRDGDDSVAWHGDRIDRIVVEPVVAILSLGAPRILRLRPKGGGRSIAFSLHCGDLLVMGGTCQRTWEHCVPKSRRACGPRVSLMFREPSPTTER